MKLYNGSNWCIKFISANKNLILKNDFKELHRIIYNATDWKTVWKIGELTRFLLDAKIDPLLYMQKVPSFYMTDSSGFVTVTHIKFNSSINIPSNINEIADYGFYDCESLKNIEIPSNVHLIDDFAFEYCNNLTNVLIENGAEIFGDKVFANCFNLKAIVLPNTVRIVGTEMFKDCTSLKTVVLSNNLKTISYKMFTNCANLTTIMIPEGVEIIQQKAFKGCASLKQLALPKSITKIDLSAFDSTLDILYYAGSESDWAKINFYGSNDDFKNKNIKIVFKA